MQSIQLESYFESVGKVGKDKYGKIGYEMLAVYRFKKDE